MKHLLATVFKDKRGRVVLFQWPNIPIVGWALCELTAAAVHYKPAASGLLSLATALLLVWAYLEIRYGVTYFRRGLGTCVAVMVIIGYFTG